MSRGGPIDHDDEEEEFSTPLAPPRPSLEEAIRSMRAALRAHRHRKIDWMVNIPGHGMWLETSVQLAQAEGMAVDSPLQQRAVVSGRGDVDGLGRLALPGILEKQYPAAVMQLACDIILNGKWEKGDDGIYSWNIIADVPEDPKRKSTVDPSSPLFGAISQIIAAYRFAEIGGMNASTQPDRAAQVQPGQYVPLESDKYIDHSRGLAVDHNSFRSEDGKTAHLSIMLTGFEDVNGNEHPTSLEDLRESVRRTWPQYDKNRSGRQ